MRNSNVEICNLKKIYNSENRNADWEICLHQSESDADYITKSHLSWTPPLMEGAVIQRIYVKIKADGRDISTTSLTTALRKPLLDIPVNHLKCGSMYSVMVKYHFAVSGKQKTRSGSGKIETLPHPPQIETPQFSGDHVTMRWTASPTAKEYYVMASDRVGNVCMGRKRTENCKIEICVGDDLKWGNNYTLTVTAKTETGLQNSATRQVFIGNPACTPRNVTATLTKKTKITLTWDNPEKVPKTCEIKRSINGAERECCVVKNERYYEVAAEPGTSNIMYVRAIFDDQESSWVPSNEITTESRCLLVHGLAVSKCEENHARAVKVSWTGVPDATAYCIVYEGKGFKNTVFVDGEKNECTVTKLDPVTKYSIHIFAKRGEECGLPSEKQEIKTGPGKAKNALVTTVNGRWITVNFKKAMNCDQHKVKLYEEDADSSHVIGQERTLEDGWTKTTVQAPKCNTRYYIEITPLYGDTQGEEIKTGSILTGPGKMDSRKVTTVLKDECKSNCFTVYWEKQRDCDYQLHLRCCDGSSTHSMTLVLPESQNSYTYMYPGHGRKHNIKMRAKNKTGFGEWSESKTVQTAPGLVTSFNCQAEQHNNSWIMAAEWNVPLNADKVNLQLFRKGHERPLAAATPRAEVKRHVFNDHPLQDGEKYFCEICAIITEVGEGKKKASTEIEIPLAPPEVRCTLDETNPTSRVNLAITPSNGMKTARICIVNSKQRTHTEEIGAQINEWSYNCLSAGEKYHYMVYPGNGIRFSENCVSGDFTAAPPPPLKVSTLWNRANPESSLTVMVKSNYNGKTQVTAQNSLDLQEIIGPVLFSGNFVTISGLTPGSIYNVYSQHIAQGQLSSKTYSEPTRTAFPKPTEVECSFIEDLNAVKLTWKSLGVGAVYKIQHIDTNGTDHVETKKPEHTFYNLQSGCHCFQVFVDAENKSDSYEINIPEAPAIHKINLISSKEVEVICSKTPRATKYHHKLTCVGEKLPDLFGTENEERTSQPHWVVENGMPSMKQTSLSPRVSWQLEHGLTCTVSIRAESNGFFGPVITAQFSTEYNIHEIAGLINKQTNAETSEYFSKIKFQPPNVQRIHPDGSSTGADYSSFLELKEGERCVILGESGKTTTLHNFMQEKTSHLLKHDSEAFQRKIPPAIVLHLKSPPAKGPGPCTLEKYLKFLLQRVRFTKSEWGKLYTHIHDNPEKMIIVHDNFDSTEGDDARQMLEDILLGNTLPGATLLCSAQNPEASNTLHADKAAVVLDFPMSSVEKIADDLFDAKKSAEIKRILCKFDYIGKFSCNKKYCTAVLKVIKDCLFSDGQDADLESPASVAVASLSKDISSSFDPKRKKLQDLLEKLASQEPNMTGSLFEHFLKTLADFMHRTYTKKALESQSDAGMRLYAGLSRTSTLKQLQKLFPTFQFESMSNQKEVLQKNAEELLANKKWERRAIGYLIKAEVNEPFKNPLQLDMDRKGASETALYKDFLNHMVGPRYAYLGRKMSFRCGNDPRGYTKSEEAKKIIEELCRVGADLRKKQIDCLDMQNGYEKCVGMDAITRSLPNINRLRIAYSELKEEDLEKLYAAIKNKDVGSHFVLHHLNLDGNTEVAKVLESLEDCCQRVVHISLVDCELSEEKLQRYQCLYDKLQSGTLVIGKTSQSPTDSRSSLES